MWLKIYLLTKQLEILIVYFVFDKLDFIIDLNIFNCWIT